MIHKIQHDTTAPANFNNNGTEITNITICNTTVTEEPFRFIYISISIIINIDVTYSYMDSLFSMIGVNLNVITRINIEFAVFSRYVFAITNGTSLYSIGIGSMLIDVNLPGSDRGTYFSSYNSNEK